LIPRSVRVGGESAHVVLSCFGQRGGGLYALGELGPLRIDPLESTGLRLREQSFLRVLWAPSDATSAGELLIYDTLGLRKYFRIDALRDPHDIAWDGSHIRAVSAIRNSVFRIAPDGEVVDEWRPSIVPDAWHLNCLAVVDGRVVVTAFGRFDESRGWRDGRSQDTGFLFDIAAEHDVLRGLTTPHSPTFHDGSWFICEAASGSLSEYSESGELLRRLQLRGWTRGLAIGDGLMFVGESAQRYGVPTSAVASVAVVSRDSWEVIERIPVPAAEIYDITLVPEDVFRGIRRGSDTNLFRVAQSGDPGGHATSLPLDPADRRVALDVDMPRVATSGASALLEVEVRNLGQAVLASIPPFPIQVAYRWRRMGSQGISGEGRAVLTSPLAPQESGVVALYVDVPVHPGRYELHIDVVQENVAWFGDRDATSARTQLVEVT
jgi:Domain of unknown function (DUF4915)